MTGSFRTRPALMTRDALKTCQFGSVMEGKNMRVALLLVLMGVVLAGGCKSDVKY